MLLLTPILVLEDDGLVGYCLAVVASPYMVEKVVEGMVSSLPALLASGERNCGYSGK